MAALLTEYVWQCKSTPGFLKSHESTELPLDLDWMEVYSKRLPNKVRTISTYFSRQFCMVIPQSHSNLP